ncbi:MAG: N-acetyltransferase family protein [Ktedonobacterales bacterium]
MGEDTETVVVRPARPEDREAVLAFCQHTWDDGDYIEDVWEHWLTSETGDLLVAVAGGLPVGLIHLAMLSTEDAWIEGIRVDPRARRQGIGRVLTSQALVRARQRGAQVARLFTDSDNVASQELVTKKFGFQRIAEMARYVGGALPAGADADADALLETEVSVATSSGPESRKTDTESGLGPRLLLADAEDYSRLREWLNQSNLAPANGGLQFGVWNAWTLHDRDLQEYIVRGMVWLLEEWQTIQAIAIVQDMPGQEDSPGTLQVRYIDGAAGGIGTLALALREIAQEHGLAQVVLWLPDLLILQDAMNGAGYSRGSQERLLIYQRAV